MINITSLKRKNISIDKPKTLEDLYTQVCSSYGSDKNHIFLVFIEENQDKQILEREIDYESLLKLDQDLQLIAYIKPKPYSKLKIRILTAISIISYFLLQFFPLELFFLDLTPIINGHKLRFRNF